MNAKQLAKNYVTANAHFKQLNKKTGVVVLFNGKPNSWLNELRNPEAWQPGAIAVAYNGLQFVAVGGNSYEGAAQWQPITHLPNTQAA